MEEELNDDEDVTYYTASVVLSNEAVEKSGGGHLLVANSEAQLREMLIDLAQGPLYLDAPYDGCEDLA